MVKHGDALGLERPGNYQKALEVAAAASAVSSEAILLTVLHTENLTTASKKQRINSNLAKMKEQSKTYGVLVEELLHPVVFHSAHTVATQGLIAI